MKQKKTILIISLGLLVVGGVLFFVSESRYKKIKDRSFEIKVRR